MTTTGPASPYHGQPLLDEGSIRLVQVQPGWGDDSVTIRLITTPLSSCPPFEALSYAWGDVNQTEPIQVLAQASIDESVEGGGCAAALRRLRLRNEPRTLWVDAICINQSLVAERNAQLRLMTQIYSTADRAVIYLGESSGSDGSDAVMDWVHQMHAPSEGDKGRPLLPEWSAYDEFLARPWFTRVWVIREIQVARAAVVVCGEKEVPWEAFGELRNFSDNGRNFRPLPYTLQTLLLKTPDSGFWKTRYATRLLLKLQKTRHLRATDPRDKLYAILPLVDWEEEEQNKDQGQPNGNALESLALPQGDYGLSTKLVYTQLAQGLIETLGLSILSSAGYPSSIPGLPSWAPDWSVEGRRSWRDSTRRVRRRTNHGSFELVLGLEQNRVVPLRRHDSKTWRFSNHLTSDGESTARLHIRAASTETIVKLGELCNVYEDLLPLEQWMSLCDTAHLQENDSEQGVSLSNFAKTLFGSFVIYTSPARDALKRILSYNMERSSNGGVSSKRLAEIFAHWVPSYRKQAEAIFLTCQGRRLFVTGTGCLGLAPEAARIGDQVAFIDGTKTPFVTRPGVAGENGETALHLVGECYVDTEKGESVEYQEVLVR